MQHTAIRCVRLLILTALGSLLSTQVTAVQLVSTIKPLQLLAEAVIDSADSSDRLLVGQQSPHHYSLRPSAIKKLHAAELVIWSGADLEPFLEKAIKNLPEHIQLIDLSKSLVQGEGARLDPHYWLDPELAIAITTQLANRLSLVNPEKSKKYHENAAKFANNLILMDEKAGRGFAPLRQRPFIVLHDAYDYFVNYYQLNQLGAVRDSADHHHGAKNMQGLREAIDRGEVHCVITEQGAELNNSQQALIRGANLRVGELDPLAYATDVSAEGYLLFYQQLVTDFMYCLSP